MASADDNGIILNEKSMEILVAKFIPTSQYFERSFDLLRSQIEDLKDGQKELKQDMDRRFGEVNLAQKELKQDIDCRFGEVNLAQKELKQDIDRRFGEVNLAQKELKQDMDRRFEQVNQRFDQVNVKLDTIIERLDVKIDAGLRENRATSFKLFSFAMLFSAISMAGLLGKLAGIF